MKVKRLLVIFAGALVLSGASAVAAAASVHGDTTYWACLKHGMLTRVGTSSPSCPAGAHAISWNSQGQPGKTGEQGKQGPPGVVNALSFYDNDSGGVGLPPGNVATPLGTLTISSASDYIVFAKAWLSGNPVNVNCTLQSQNTANGYDNGTKVDGTETQAGVNLMFVGLGLSAGETITFSCSDLNGGMSSATVSNIQMAAIPVGNVGVTSK